MGEDRQIMNKKELQVIAQAAAKNIKTVADLNEFRQMLTGGTAWLWCLHHAGLPIQCGFFLRRSSVGGWPDEYLE
jgi:hypothetical protein